MRSRSVWLTACSGVLAAVLAGCGGGEGKSEETSQAPRIERAVAEQLATRSEAVSEHLETGNPCGAKQEAGRLRAELTAAINAGKVPELYLEDLSGAVNEIVAAIPPCEPPPLPSEGGGEEGDD